MGRLFPVAIPSSNALIPAERRPNIRDRLEPIGVQAVYRHDPVDIKLQPLEVLHDQDGADHRRIRHGLFAGGRLSMSAYTRIFSFGLNFARG